MLSKICKNMKQSKLFTKAIKELPKDELSFNAKILIQAGFIDKLSAGVYTFLPLGLRVHNKICNIIREEINAIGGQEILMPALTPREIWDKTNRWDNFDALFKLTGVDDKEYALGSTHEEVITPLAKKYVFSYKDLPVYIYQIQTKFRNEKRAKAGLIRGREFSMKDLYSFHKNKEDLDKYYEIVKKAYFRIYERCGLGEITYLTYAGGGAFSKYSHEFQVLTQAGEDIIYICDKCRIAINKEIINEQKSCPECGGNDFREEKAVEVGNIFKLGSRFSDSFDFKYTTQAGEQKEVIMGCYGVGPSRLMATIVETHNDKRGIIWPREVAPFKVHLLYLKSTDQKIKKKSEELYKKFIQNNIEVLYDDREEVGAGKKFADADLIGCPMRIVISEKTISQGKIEIKRRDSDEVALVKFECSIENVKEFKN